MIDLHYTSDEQCTLIQGAPKIYPERNLLIFQKLLTAMMKNFAY